MTANTNAFWEGFWTGLAGDFVPANIHSRTHVSRISATRPRASGVVEALRSDWQTIGGDFNKVIARETAHTSK